MTLEHLFSDAKMRRLYGPQSEIGDKSVYLAEMPKITVQGFGPSIGKVSMFIRYFGNNVMSGEKQSDYYYTEAEMKKYAKKDPSYPPKPNRVTFKDTNQFFNKVIKLNEHREFDNVIFCGGEPLLWQMEIAKIIRLSSEQLDHRMLSYDIETNGTMPIEPEISDWFKRANLNIRPNLSIDKGYPLIAQLMNHRSARQKERTWTHFEHEHWFVIFTYEDNLDKIQEIVERYKIPKNRILLESKENPLECMSACIQTGYRYSPSLEIQ